MRSGGGGASVRGGSGAELDEVDSSCPAAGGAQAGLARWDDSGAAEQLRDRFVTGAPPSPPTNRPALQRGALCGHQQAPETTAPPPLTPTHTHT